jgi:hypothetical protein
LHLCTFALPSTLVTLSPCPYQSPIPHPYHALPHPPRRLRGRRPCLRPEEIRKEFVDKLMEKSKAATELDKLLTHATSLETEIRALESDKNFKNMKVSAFQMTTYNNLKRNNIINVKYTSGRKNVKLSTILQNIQVSTNLKGLREDKDKKEKEKMLKLLR